MCRKATVGWHAPACLILAAASLAAQTPVSAIRPEWRRIGSAAIDLQLAAPATGPVDRVWYSPDGKRLFALTSSGRTYETVDFERWQPVAPSVKPPAPPSAVTPSLPETNARVQGISAQPTRYYSLGRQAWRSDDGGSNWANLTSFRGSGILGEGLTDLAISPLDPDHIAIASKHGVWRSVDGGLSWSGINATLPNLPVRALSGLPSGVRGTRILLEQGEFEWQPGEKNAWRLADPNAAARDLGVKQWLSAVLNARITAQVIVGETIYAGASDGRLWSSPDRGRTWRPFGTADGGAVLSITADPRDPRLALAALGSRPEKAAHVLRTFNGGIFWDDWTSNLPEAPVHALAADRASGAVYAASDAGVFYTVADPLTPGPATQWSNIGARLPAAAAMDVKLDAAGNQLYVALEGFGVYATLAPHRLRDVRPVNAADFSARSAAPGSLLSILGAQVQSAKSGSLSVPVLAASETESQLQVPFEATGATLPLALQSPTGAYQLGVALEPVSPAIFVDRDGTPMLLDGDSGMVLDSAEPARAGGRIQILATGLGRVRPDWPTGLAAPLENAPAVIAEVKAFVDGVPAQVTRATLAPGYIGFYVVDVQLPPIVNNGPAELYLDLEGRQSNHVRLFVEQ